MMIMMMMMGDGSAGVDGTPKWKPLSCGNSVRFWEGLQNATEFECKLTMPQSRFVRFEGDRRKAS